MPHLPLPKTSGQQRCASRPLAAINTMRAVAISGVLLALVYCAAAASPRSRSSFDADWRFKLGPESPSGRAPPNSTSCAAGLPCDPAYDDSGWRSLSVPHDFVVEGTTVHGGEGGGGLLSNVSWYRKEFSLDASASEGRLVWLTFDGVFRNAVVYLNGALVMRHVEGYTSWTAYLHNSTAPLKFGSEKNVLAVFVDATEGELWCYEGGGIFRHVWLETAGTASIVPWGFYAPTLVNGTITGANATAAQTVDSAIYLPRLDLQNAHSSKSISATVKFTLTSQSTGKIALTHTFPGVTIAPGGFQRVVPGPIGFGSAADPIELWNTAAAPPLYTATATVLDGSTVLDELAVTIGVRSAVFDSQKGFLLNGIKVQLMGTANHLGFGAVGMAVPDR